MFLGFLAWIVGGLSQGMALKAVDDIVFVVLTVPAVLLAAMAARSTDGRLRAAWIAMAIGLLGWALGDILWAYYELALEEVPFPSIADAAYLVMPVGFCVALLLFPAERSGPFRGRMLLDGLIVAGSLFLVSWVTILSSLYQTGADTMLALIISLAYPISDVVILTIAAVALVRSAPDQRSVLTLLTLGMACIALADSAFAYLSAKGEYATGNVIDIGWVAGLLLIMVAAVASREGAHHENGSVELPGWASIWFPYAPLLLTGIVAAAEPPGDFSDPACRDRGWAAGGDGAGPPVPRGQREPPAARSGGRTSAARPADRAGQPRDVLRTARPCDAATGTRPRIGSLIALDLNDFKLVNDALGHPAGDELLNRAGERILGCVRNSDTVRPAWR